MPHRPDLVCSLRFIGEDDILDRLTSDCASNNDEPPKVECDCCTECYVGTGETLAISVSDPPTKDLSEVSDPPTASPVIVSDPPTVAPVTPDPSSAPVSDPPTVSMVSDPSPSPAPTLSSKQVGETNPPAPLVTRWTPSQEATVSPEAEPDVEPDEGSSVTPEAKISTEDSSTPGTRNEIQTDIGHDSNDWHEYAYREEAEIGQQ